MGAVRACFVIALITVTGVQAVVKNQMTDDQFNHSEEMAKTPLANPEYGMKVFVYYTDQKNPLPIWVPAVITGVNNMLDGSVEINVRYLDGSTRNSRVNLDNVVYRDNSVSYENWTLHDYDPLTMLENGQPRTATGSRSRPFVVAPSKKAAFHGGSSSGGGASGGSSSGGGAAKRSSPGGGAAKRSSPKTSKTSSPGGGAAEKRRKVAHATTDKEAMDEEEEDRENAEWAASDAANDLLLESIDERDAAVGRADQSDLRATAAEERASAAEARIAAAEERATAADERASAAEARIAAAEERAAAAEARATTAAADVARADRSTRTRNPPVLPVYDHRACRDYKGMGGGN